MRVYVDSSNSVIYHVKLKQYTASTHGFRDAQSDRRTVHTSCDDKHTASCDTK